MKRIADTEQMIALLAAGPQTLDQLAQQLACSTTYARKLADWAAAEGRMQVSCEREVRHRVATLPSVPVRVQRQRTRGWRAPDGCVYVGRPTKWGNPFTPAKYREMGYRATTAGARQACVNAFADWLENGESGESWFEDGRAQWHWIRDHMSSLRGKALMCWCSLNEPCHADVLLRLANGG